MQLQPSVGTCMWCSCNFYHEPYRYSLDEGSGVVKVQDYLFSGWQFDPSSSGPLD